MGLLLLIVATVVVGLHVHRYPKLSPIDELQHFDYLVKASRGELVRSGERIGQEALREEACRGIDAAFMPPPCDSDRFDPGVYQELGYNTAASQSPLYYATSGVVARFVAAVARFDSLLTAARLTGAVWLALGALTTWALGRRLGARPPGLAVVMVLLFSSPVVLHATATVNTDAVLLAAGGAVLLAGLVAEERRGWWFALPSGAAIAAFVAEPTTTLASGTAALYLVLRFCISAKHGYRQQLGFLMAGLALLPSVYLTNEATSVFKRSTALDVTGVVLPKDTLFAATDISSENVLGMLPALMTPLRDPYLPPFLDNPPVKGMVRLVDMALLGGLIGAVLFGRRRSKLEAMAAACLAVCLIAGPALVVYNFWLSRIYFPIPSRYGLSVVPAILAVLAASLRKTTAIAAVAVVAAITGVLVLSALV